MSLLEHSSVVRSATSRRDELEDAFRAWADDPTKPDVVDLGPHGDVPMAELSRRLGGSRATLSPSACAKIGVPDGATIATATAELLHATVDPDGPRCRSFRAASYYLRGLARLDAERRAVAEATAAALREDPRLVTFAFGEVVVHVAAAHDRDERTPAFNRWPCPGCETRRLVEDGQILEVADPPGDHNRRKVMVCAACAVRVQRAPPHQPSSRDRAEDQVGAP